MAANGSQHPMFASGIVAAGEHCSSAVNREPDGRQPRSDAASVRPARFENRSRRQSAEVELAPILHVNSLPLMPGGPDWPRAPDALGEAADELPCVTGGDLATIAGGRRPTGRSRAPGLRHAIGAPVSARRYGGRRQRIVKGRSHALEAADHGHWARKHGLPRG
jgi:hypothetical protein